METTPNDGAYILRVDSCLTPRETVHNASVLCRNGLIEAVGSFDSLTALAEVPCIDMRGCQAIPGLVDTHLHGSGGVAAMDADQLDSLAPISQLLARHGVTSFVCTILSAKEDKMLRVAEALGALSENEMPGAVPLGLHYEGPYLRVEKRGAQRERYIRPIDLGEARELLQAGKGTVRMMTLAPELENSEKLIEMLLEHNAIPSMGHSLADENEVTRAIDCGATRVTHLYNGTTRLDQRSSGLTSVALVDDRVTIELIADGIHVHPVMLEIACRAKPLDRIVGISDATQGAGLRNGIYHLGDDRVEIANGWCRRFVDGRIAGSCLTLDLAMRNLPAYTSLGTEEVLTCFTRNPARSLGFEDRGVLLPGKRADIAVVDPDWKVRMTIVGGRVVYDARTAELPADWADE
ncbi:MAG: N-acetylglucosamine-6-phosphate deacetylase [Victivallales bacterium]|nr:N-acetylglucosamine-6-phosphate deacetylase [Victivallales bacterium]MBT7300828.1 N-acetylglucosamine-6-phosphate deacetylase [Victivallales bacterium]